MLSFGRLKIGLTPLRAGPLCAGLLALALPAFGDPAEPLARDYAESSAVTIKIGDSLYEALPLKLGNHVDAVHPLAVVSDAEPFIGLDEPKDKKKAIGEVVVSSGLLDFLNHLAHAKAADQIAPGYFDDYLKRLSANADSDTDHTRGAHWPAISDDRFWTLPVRNRQMSLFNQMVSVLAAINLSHYYLGHYAKYAPQLAAPDHAPRSINPYLTRSEWEASVKAGSINSMVCALAPEGAATLFEALAKMPQRPPWTACLAPPSIDLTTLSKELTDYETNFFQGRLDAENSR